MSRYARLDTDEERLPEGMQRVGYDADTQQYSYVDSQGAMYEGSEGNRYGQLQPTGRHLSPGQARLISEPALREQNRRAWRYMLPFFLIVIVVLFLVFRILDRGAVTCPPNSTRYEIKSGDTCYGIAEKLGVSLDTIQEMDGVDCDRLQIGRELCIPNPE